MNDDSSYRMHVKLEPETLDLSTTCDARYDDHEAYSSQDSNDYVSDGDQSNADYSSFASSFQFPFCGDSADSPIDVRTSVGPNDLCYDEQSRDLDGEQPGSPKRICLVCSDTASGFHYGVASCEACKAFFKRTIQGNISYTCPAFGNCEITKRRRKACQACRFEKCLTVGMLKEGVRLDRVRGGRQKYRRIEGSTPAGTAVAIQMQHKKSTSNNSPGFLSILNAIEPEKVFAFPDHTLPDDDFKLMTTLSDLADRELVATISWAKQVPGFLYLPLTDQMNLLQSTWMDVLCFNEAFRSVPYSGLIVFADDFKCSEVDCKQLGFPSELDSLGRRLALKMSHLAVTKEEYLFLKTILFLNPDITVKQSHLVQQLRDKVQDALLEHLHVQCPGTANRRMCDLFFLFPLLMHKKILAKEFWFGVKRSGRVNLHKLLSEMLDFMSV